MKNKRIVFLIVLIILIAIGLFIFFSNNETRNFKIGNNTSSQEIVDYILNINSYEAIIEVDVKSNKNENKYKIKQVYNGENNNSHEVLEPSNIAGVKLIKEGNNLKLENSNLNLTNIMQNYEYISDNVLDLYSFIEDYKSNTNSKWEEKNDKIVMKTSNRTLYINRENGLLEKMEIHDNSKKTAIYILYNEVNVNS
ncbi:MAG: hypothetical protein U0L98_00085 [Clostridia bacterium]|nr:hypothetical protein [Clostridia bacterium]